MITAAERDRLRDLAAAEVAQHAPPPAPAQLAVTGALLGPAASAARTAAGSTAPAPAEGAA